MTLIEILIVVVLLGVISGMAVPRFSPAFSQFQLRQTAGDFAHTMRYAQSRAITGQRLMRLRLDSIQSRYWVEEGPVESVSGDSTHFKRMTGRLGRKIRVSNAIVMESQKNNVVFYPDGQIDKLRIYVCAKDSCYTISTQEQRGYVRLVQGRIPAE